MAGLSAAADHVLCSRQPLATRHLPLLYAASIGVSTRGWIERLGHRALSECRPRTYSFLLRQLKGATTFAAVVILRTMPTELQSLDTIFNSRVFRIPDYQRGFAWETRQLDDFWQDLDRLGDQRNHYTGQLTFERVPEGAWKSWDEDNWLIQGKGYKPFYVVDGQQRLTTAIILIKTLLDRIPNDGQLAFAEKRDHVQKYLSQASAVSRAYLFGYQKDNPSYEFLKTQILGDSSNQFQGTETTYTANLSNAREFFRGKLKSVGTVQIERWFRALTQRFLFNVYELQEQLDVFVVFETMNNRGKPLSKLELLKNRLIYLSTLLPDSTMEEDRRALRRNINDAWKTVYEFLGREKGSPLDDDDFLRAHWIMYFTYSRDEAGKFASFLLDEHFTAERAGSGALTISEIQNYVSSVQSSARKWHAIHFPERISGLSDKIRRCLERLDRLGRGAFEPLVMAAMQAEAKDAELDALLKAAERFIFLVGRLCQRRADTGDSRFYRLAGEVFRGEKTLSEATDKIRERTEEFFSLEKATADMRDLFRRGEDGFYGWQGLRYFLFEYEQFLKEQAGMNTSRLNWSDFTTSKKDHVTIEHIYPQNPTSGEWPGFDAKTKKERKVLRNSLGNMLALSQSRNSKLSNRPFSVKKKDSDGVIGYSNGSYSEISVSKLGQWTPDEVIERGFLMLEFLEKRWEVSLGSHDQKLALLNLGDDATEGGAE